MSFKEMEKGIFEEILTALTETTEAERGESFMTDAQPPTSVIEAAAKAATQVIMSFERGYRMNKR